MAEHTIDIDNIIGTFLKALGKKGYSIGIDAHIKARQVLHWFLKNKKGNSLSDFAKYLSPVICKNDTEQANFKKEFEELFLSYFSDFEKAILDEETERIKIIEAEKNAKNKKLRNRVLIGSISTIVLVITAAIIWHINHPVPPSKLVKIEQRIAQPFYINRNNEIPFSHTDIFITAADSSKFNLEYKFYHSQKTKKGTAVIHSFDHYGKDTVAVKIKSKNPGVDTLLIYPEINVGPQAIIITTEKQAVTKGGSNTFTAEVDTLVKTKFHWEINNNKDTAVTTLKNNPVTYTFNDTGLYTIKAKYNIEGDSFLHKFPARIISTTYTQKVSMAGLQVNVTSLPPVKESVVSVNKIWILALLLLALLFLYGAFKALQKRNKEMRKVNVADDAFKSKKPPYNLVFLPRDKEVKDVYTILRLANDLKKRVEATNESFFDVTKTISQTIANRGFITPAFAHKKINREYLFLIDHAYTNSQLMQLFKYLVQYLQSHSVKLNFYFFYQTPDKFYKKADGPRITLDNLKDRYYDSTLIIFAEGNNFLEWESNGLKTKITSGLIYWANRVLVTPVAFNDWGSNEKILSTFFNVLPADVAGLMELIRAIETDTGEASFTGKFSSYASKYVDFTNINSLQEYLGENENGELFQWVCALAIHPKLYWELIIALGKSILKDPSKINYDTLLKLARIKWIREGSLPPAIRLALLKKLNKENEKTARATLLKMLDEMPEKEELFSYEEKQLSRYTNSFALVSSKDERFAFDERLLAGQEKFLSLYKNKKLNDNPLKIYLEKKETANDTWSTLTTTSSGNDSIENYIKEKETLEAELSKTERRKYNNRIARYLGAAVFTLLLLATLFFGKDNIAAKPDINKYLHFVDVETVNNNTVQTYLEVTACLKKLIAQSTDTTATLEISNDNAVLFNSVIRLRDTLITKTFEGLAYDSTKILQYKIFANGQVLQNTIPLLPGRYTISVSGCPDDLSAVTYYRGDTEDTTAVFKTFANTAYRVNVIKPQGYANANTYGTSTNANAIIFDSAIDRTARFDIANRLLQNGFPLKHVGIDGSHGAFKNIVVKATDKLIGAKNITVDSLRCLLLGEGCDTPIKPKPPVIKQVVQVFFSTNIQSGNINGLISCINTINTLKAEGKNGGAPTRAVYELHYFRDNFKDSASLLLRCINNYFSGKTFKLVKKQPVANNTIAAQIYISDSVYMVSQVPQVLIKVSDERLKIGAAQMISEISKEGITVLPVQVTGDSKINSNEITYNYAELADDAKKIKSIYEKYFGDIPVTIKYVAASSSQKQITISITNYKPRFGITNLNYADADGNFSISFRIGYLDTKVSTLSRKLTGKICLELITTQQAAPEIFCADIEYSSLGMTNVSQRISTANKTSGRYAIRLTTTEPRIDTILSRITIDEKESCDTINSYVGLSKQGTRFENTTLQTKGYILSLIERNDKYAVFTLQKDKCEVDTIQLNISQTKTLTMCDGNRFTLTFKKWQNKTGAKADEAIFEAIICEPKKGPAKN